MDNSLIKIQLYLVKDEYTINHFILENMIIQKLEEPGVPITYHKIATYNHQNPNVKGWVCSLSLSLSFNIFL